MRADDAGCGLDGHVRLAPVGQPRGPESFRSRRRPKLIVDEYIEYIEDDPGDPVEFDAATFESRSVWVATDVQRVFTAFHGCTAAEAIENIRLVLRLAADRGKVASTPLGMHRFSWERFSVLVTPDLQAAVRYKTFHFERTPQMVADGVRSRLGRKGASVRKRPLPDGLEIGDVVSGVVENVVMFGAFVDIGECDGLLHVSQFGEGVIDAREVIEPGADVICEIIAVDYEAQRLNLRLIDSAHSGG
ncbi:S1 RNA-binding domain-containing protein [Gemmatimonas sp.]|uniref:S1 RNA-binding domain-containing protein n=1 Tax=Gemmatimonas sp. TaxID=1962908 RepID=UPI0035649515